MKLALSLVLVCLAVVAESAPPFFLANPAPTNNWEGELYFRKLLEITLLFEDYIFADIIYEIRDILRPENAKELSETYKASVTIDEKTGTAIPALEKLPSFMERKARFAEQFNAKLANQSPEGKQFVHDMATALEQLMKKENQNMLKFGQILLEVQQKYNKLSKNAMIQLYIDFPEIHEIFQSPVHKLLVHIAEAN